MEKYITESERYQIEILLKDKHTIMQIAELLNIKYNTLYKEIKKGMVKQLDSNLKERIEYKADYAHMLYEKSVANRGRNLKIGTDLKLVQYIEKMVKKKYSPSAILMQIRNEGLIFDTELCVKTIYNYFEMGLFLNASIKDLPSKRKICNSSKQERISKVALNNRKARTIEHRPINILDRNVYGHWEMDTVVSAKNTGKSCLLVLSERMTREEIIIKIRNKKACSTVHALNMLERKLGSKKFKEKFKTITMDNGVEFLDCKGIEKSLYTKTKRTTTYYCHPYSSCERGTNENINKMIRRFFPKGTNFDLVTKQEIEYVEKWINNYPRKILGGLSSNLYKMRNVA